MRYSNKWLLAQIEEGRQPKYLFFWGHRPSKDGSITASCFSQWWEGSPFREDGQIYPTAEHWMMAGKARLFGDADTLAHILTAKTPAEAKELGRAVKDFDPSLWETQKNEIVISGNYLKFSQHESLKMYLLSTADRVIVEASPVDAIWGTGMAADHPQIHHPANWRGENLLGYALMEVRDKLKEQ